MYYKYGRARKKKSTFHNERPKGYYKRKTPLDTSLKPTTWADNNQPLTDISVAIRNPRRGLFYAHHLLQHKDAKLYEQENGSLEYVTVIRFPPDIAQALRQRLTESWLQTESSLYQTEDNCHDIENRKKASVPSLHQDFDLGLTITPTSEEDYRVFHLTFEQEWKNPSSRIHLRGILLELPCLLEAYKSLEDELLFKCNDISQLLYVYYKDHNPPFDIRQKRVMDFWEWKSGLSAGTHRIRSRKYKSFNVFKKKDVSQVEEKLYNRLASPGLHETLYLEVSNHFTMESESNALYERKDLNNKNLVSIIRSDNPIFKAAVMGVSLKEGAKHFFATQQLFINGNEHANDTLSNLQTLVKFNGNSSTQLKLDDPIPDDLSDYLFGNIENTLENEDAVGVNTKETMVEEMYEEDTYFQNPETSDHFARFQYSE